MPFIKQRQGLLERDDFYLTSSFSDFLGNAQYTRTENCFELRSGEIKRHFTYEEFVIDVKKEARELGESDRYHFFIETSLGRAELHEVHGGEPTTDWRILCHDRFIQTYYSIDHGITWVNVEGYALKEDEKILYQGFKQEGETFLKITEYKVYYGPFLEVQNFPEDFKAELYDKENNLVQEKFFNSDMTAKLFLDATIQGYLKVYTPEGQLVAESDIQEFGLGDRYIYTPYEVEVSYRENILGYGPTYLGEIEVHSMKVRNKSNELYRNLVLKIDYIEVDTVQLSFDDIEYKDFIQITELAAGEEREFYIKVTKKFNHEFIVREFELQII